MTTSAATTTDVPGAQSGSTRRLLEPFLFLYITEQCQLRCSHCYMGDRLQSGSRMTAEQVDAILSYLRVTAGQYKVYLLGGEPTTHPDLDRILASCRQQSYKVVLTSNGLIPDRTWEILDDRIDVMSFSLDGASTATHEAMRGKNTFRPLLRSIDRAVAAGMQTRAIFTVTTANAHEIADAIDLADNVGLQALSFHYFTPTGRGRDHPEYQVPAPHWARLTRQIRERARGRRVRVFYPPAFASPDDLGELVELGYRGCTARSLERLAIFPDGRVYICSMFFDTDLHYGHFVDGQIVPRFAQPAGELALVSGLAVQCRDCAMAAGCGGGCSAYDHLGLTKASGGCGKELVPICPLWSVPAVPDDTADGLRDLR